MYLISPVDLILDIPIVGHLEDFLVVATGSLQVLQGYAGETSKSLASIVKMLKWAIIILGAILVLIILILGTLIIKIIEKL